MTTPNTGKYLVIEKYCHRCNDTLPAEKFFRNRARLDGLAQWCKICYTNYLREKDKSGVMFQRKKIRKLKNFDVNLLPEKIKQIAACYIENPKVSCEEIALKVELSPNTVRAYASHNDFLLSLKHIGAKRLTGMIPEALESLNSSLSSKSEEVKLKAAVKVLENENILGPDKVEITISPYANKSFEELVKISEGQVAPKAPTFEAELVS